MAAGTKVIYKEKAFITEDTESTEEDTKEGFYSATSNSVAIPLCTSVLSVVRGFDCRCQVQGEITLNSSDQVTDATSPSEYISSISRLKCSSIARRRIFILAVRVPLAAESSSETSRNFFSRSNCAKSSLTECTMSANRAWTSGRAINSCRDENGRPSIPQKVSRRKNLG